MRILATLVIALLILPAAAAETQPSAMGLWRVADGTATIRIKRCDDALCGFVASAPAPEPGAASAVGQKILIDMRQDGEIWRGTIFNLDDGQTYTGEISTQGDLLKVKGCLPAGICGGETWRREADEPEQEPAPKPKPKGKPKKQRKPPPR
ncbi:DUF2147 domain-containing protein [Rhodoblastus acidophilus]|uniref:DUF2147 domain-containing protein n=1 Tax=Rhodoblastus acidophilus TaxID=1074 RepID=A0A6N8DKE4_RHOAC|nr:DUF2147 domain-containing protein [Rhodoblastus acidophilus]MCW2274234.1 uncharacterized protein (DUF2147 family) [Rhodoblastus acidophilus]MTV30798.1 DUF2147 domain-containing protein [Rhodoblastus acidophilus]